MEESSSAKVARKETTDEATDVSLEHWGRGAELIGDQVAGLEKHVEATDVVEESGGAKSSREKVPGVESPDEVLDVSSGHWGQVAVLPHEGAPEVRLQHGVKVGAGTTDEAPDDEHRGLVEAAPHPCEAPDEEHRGG